MEPTLETTRTLAKLDFSKTYSQISQYNFPESHRPYTDKYFLRTKEILEKEGLNPYVRAQVFIRNGPGLVLGIEEAIEATKKYCPKLIETGAIYAKHDGEEYTSSESIMYIDGYVQDFIELETLYLGIISARTTFLNDGVKNVDLQKAEETMRKIVSLIGDRPVSYFGARHWHYSEDAEIAKAAIRGGATSASTDIGAESLGIEGSGTIPHALENVMALYYGKENAVVEATLAFDRHIDKKIPRIALIDYNNKEITDSLAVANALKDKLYAVRVDTCGENVAEGAIPCLNSKEAVEWKEKGLYLPDEKDSDLKYWVGHGVTVSGVHNLRKALDQAGFENVKIILTSGFGNPEKVKAFCTAEEKLGLKLFDALGVGGIYHPCRTTTMDLVLAGDTPQSMIPISKVGRGYKPNDKLTKIL